jgi:prevent-host-death family protein
MAASTNIFKAKSNLSALIKRALAGEEVIISKANKPIVKIVPYIDPKAKKRRPVGSKLGPGWMADDFDAPLEDMKDYM